MSNQYVLTNQNFQQIRSVEEVYNELVREVQKVISHPNPTELVAEEDLDNMKEYYAFIKQYPAKLAFMEGYQSAINEVIRVLANVSTSDSLKEGSESYKRLEETIKYFYSKEAKLH